MVGGVILAASLICATDLVVSDETVVPAEGAAIDVAAGDTVSCSGRVTGSGTITKTGDGKLIFANGSNDWTGGVTLRGGKAQADAEGAFGAGGLVVSANGEKEPGAWYVLNAEGATFTNTFRRSLNHGRIVEVLKSATFGGDLLADGACSPRIVVAEGATATFNGRVVGCKSKNYYLSGKGAIVFNGKMAMKDVDFVNNELGTERRFACPENAFSAFDMYGARIVCDAAHVLNGAVFRNSSSVQGGTLDLNGYNQTVAGFANVAGKLTGTVLTPAGRPATLTCTAAQTCGFVFKGPLSLVVDCGTGNTNAFTAVSPMTGEVSVRSGTLALTGSAAFTGITRLTVVSGATVRVTSTAKRPFPAGMALDLAEGAVLELPPDASLAVDALSYGGKPLLGGVYGAAECPAVTSGKLVVPARLTAGNVEILLARAAPRATQFAAKELKTFLDRVLDADVPVVNAPNAARLQIALGTNQWSAAAGASLVGKARDTYLLRVKEGRVYIVGNDADQAVDWLISQGRATDLRSLYKAARATCFGVYAFLERFAGCRFYFPGELGEIVPRLDGLEIPGDLDLAVTPRFSQRTVSLNSGASGSDQLLNWVRLGLTTDHIQCGHGLNAFDYARRFADTHPEYFCLKSDGTRATLKVDPNPEGKSHSVGQLCHTSAIWDEITEDVLSYLGGESATHRMGEGYGWGKNCGRGVVDIMPQDGMWKCRCANCLAAYDEGDDYADTLIWGHTAAVAQRIQDAGLDGRVAQMAYKPYAAVPAFDLPTNIDVMVSTAGPWSLKDENVFAQSIQGVLDWSAKVGHAVWLWTYSGKVNAMDLPAAPQVAPKAWGKYYQRLAPHIFGALNESESDSFYFNYLNYYVFSRVAWDPSVDVDAIVAEHHRLMYGEGAGEMTKFFDRLEDIWINELTREDGSTSTGGEPSYSPPMPYKLLTQVYSKTALLALRGHLDAATAAVAPESDAARRICFADEQLFRPIWKRARTYQVALEPATEDARRARARQVYVVPTASAWWCQDMTRKVEGDAMEFVMTASGGKAQHSLKSAGVTLKPNTRYRVSCYLTAHLGEISYETAKQGGGFLFEMTEDSARKHLHRVTGIFGERPREVYGFDFTTGPEVANDGYFGVYSYGVTGTVLMEGLAVLELGPAGTVFQIAGYRGVK